MKTTPPAWGGTEATKHDLVSSAPSQAPKVRQFLRAVAPLIAAFAVGADLVIAVLLRVSPQAASATLQVATAISGTLTLWAIAPTLRLKDGVDL